MKTPSARIDLMKTWLVVAMCLVAWAGCGPVMAPCNAQSCASGCCDSAGQCRPGFDILGCGFGGNACARCEASQVCNTGRCEATFFGAGGGSAMGGGVSAGGAAGGGSGGGLQAGGAAGGSAGGAAGGSSSAGGRAGGTAGGSSSAGGRAGGSAGGTVVAGGATAGGSSSSGGGAAGGLVVPNGGGAPAGCTTFTQSFVTQTGGYSNAAGLDEATLATLRTGTTGLFYQLDTRVMWSRLNVPTNVVVPGVLDLSQGTAKTCSGCVTLRNCSLSTGCPTSFLARGGSMEVLFATRATPGSFIVNLHHVRFDEWLLGADTPVSAGRCFYLPSATFNVNFP